MTAEFEYIDDQADLLSVVQDALGAPVYALDTEFHRETTYFAKVCLVQLAWGSRVALVDALRVDLRALAPLLAGPGLCVIHACTQDLEILLKEVGTVPSRLFDPQLAASFLGWGTPNLGRLVQDGLDRTLQKGAQLADWTRRPLAPDELRYAADDVVHLVELTEALCARLAERGRLAWCEEECERVRVDVRVGRDPQTAWWKVKGSASLRPRAAAVAQELMAFRERVAMQADIPVRRVIPDVAVLAMIDRPPKTVAELERVRGLDRRSLRGHERGLLDALERGRSLDPADVQLPPSSAPPSAPPGLIALAMAWASQRAEDECIDLQRLGKREEIAAYVSGQRGTPLSEGWRHELLGRSLTRLVEGQVSLGIDGGRVVMVER
ncbi:MAG: HRDC domain-containing protein [Myxococcales bacterium]|nr:HRDC domain-containing protein [Myxococcales bacterium]